MSKLTNELFAHVVESVSDPDTIKRFREVINESWKTAEVFKRIRLESKEYKKQKKATSKKGKIVFDDVKYKIKNGTAQVVGLTADSGGLVKIPPSIQKNDKEYAVIGIKSEAFSFEYDLYRISIPYGVKRIKPATFQNCSKLKYVELPDSIESIESEAFSGCGRLNPLLIPESVKFISDDAFKHAEAILYGTNSYLVDFAHENDFYVERQYCKEYWYYVVKTEYI